MQDSAATNSRGAFHIITMKSDIASLDKKIFQEPIKVTAPSAPIVNKTEPPKAIPQQPVKPAFAKGYDEAKPKIPVQLKDSNFEYQKTSANAPLEKPKNIIDPDLIELSTHETILDVPPPPPVSRPEKSTINLELETPPVAPIQQQEKQSFKKDDFELQIENPAKEDKNILEDISFSKKLEKEKDSIAKTFEKMAGEQNPELEKVVIGESEPIPPKPVDKIEPKASAQSFDKAESKSLPEKPRPDTNPNDDLSIYDKHEIVNPIIVKEANTEIKQAIQPEKKIEVKTFQAPTQIKIEEKPQAPKDPIEEKLLEIEKEKEKIKEERKIVYADCKKDLTDIDIQKEKQNKIKFDFLGKIKDIKFNELEPLLNQEQNLEKQLSSIKEQETTASTVEQEEILFAKRSDIESQRQDTEKKRWQTEDKIQNLKIQIKDAENKIDDLSEKERAVNAKREKFNNKVERIEYQEKRWLLEKELTALKSNLEKLSNEYANLIPEKDKLNSLLKDVLISKTQLDKEITDLEIQEAKLPFEQKRSFEQKRQQKEKERQDKAKQAIDSRKKKEIIEKRIGELSISIKEIEGKEKDITIRIQTIEKALSGEM